MRRDSRTIRRAVIGAVASAAALALSAPSVLAGTYQVYSCESASGQLSPAWEFRVDNPNEMAAEANCPRAADIKRGIVARTRANAGQVQKNENARALFVAPSGTTIKHLEADLDGWRETRGWESGLFSSRGIRLAGCGPDGSEVCSFGNSPSRAHFDLDDPYIYLMVVCRDSGGCTTATTGRQNETLQARVRLGAAIVTIEDPSSPQLSANGGSVWSGAWQRGNVAAAFEAADNTGISRSRLLVDGKVINELGGACDYRYARPCQDARGSSLAFDSRTLSDGSHDLQLDTFDASGNRTVIAKTLYVDNTAPAEVSDLHVEGGEAPRRSPQFTVGWSAFEDSASPITKVHMRRCDSGGCETTVIARPADDRTAVTVPKGGDHELRIALEDQAGNVSNWSNPVALRFDARLDVLLGLEHNGKYVRGTLQDAGGRPLGGRELAVEGQPLAAGFKSYKREASVSTDADGRFSYHIPRGPSRRLRFSVAEDGSHLGGSASVEVHTRGKTSFRTSHSNARNGERIRFSGRVAKPLGGRGKLVALQYRRSGQRWRTFKTTRSKRSGLWRAPYRFQNTTATETYRFRAKLPVEASYPYGLGYSRELRLRVEGRKR